MAFSITDGQLAVLIRAASDEDNVPSQIVLAIKCIAEAAKELIVQYAPGPGGGSNVPDPPDIGHYILSDNGKLAWVTFPAP